MAATIRRARKQDYTAVMRLMETAFKAAQDTFAAVQPTHYRRERWVPDHNLVMETDGRIVSLVRLVPLQLCVDGPRLKTGGIGVVSTLPDHRGKGHMSQLLQAAVARMEREDYALSILGGLRDRYGRFGWEIAGRALRPSFSVRSLADAGVERAADMRRVGRQEDLLARVARAHERQLLRAVRRRNEYWLSLVKRRGTETYCADGKQGFAYVTLRGKDNIAEYGGRPRGVLSLIRSLLDRRKLGALIGSTPAGDYAPTELLAAASAWSVYPLGMIRLVRLARVLEGFLPQLSRHWGGRGTATLTLNLLENDETVTLRLGRDVTLAPTRSGRSHKVSLGRRDMASLLFGPVSTVSLSRFGPAAPLLRALFPLDLYLWNLDRV